VEVITTNQLLVTTIAPRRMSSIRGFGIVMVSAQECFRSGFFSSRVESSLGYRVYAEEHVLYEEGEVRIEIPCFVNHDWPIWAELKADLPSPTTNEPISGFVWLRVRRALMWLGWTVTVQRHDGTVESNFPSTRMRSEFSKSRWSPLSDA